MGADMRQVLNVGIHAPGDPAIGPVDDHVLCMAPVYAIACTACQPDGRKIYG
jgi:hypothetical protein